jgi:hypothetical protein
MNKEINVLSLSLRPKGLLKLIEGDKLIIINCNELAIYKDGLFRLKGGKRRVEDIGNFDVEFRYA